MNSLLTLPRLCTNGQLIQGVPLNIAGQLAGVLRPELAEKIIATQTQHILRPTNREAPQQGLELAPDFAHAPTAALAVLQDELAAKGILPSPTRENERVDIKLSFGDAPLAQADRNLIFPFGIKVWGVHVLVHFENGDYLIAQRSQKVFTFRGCYDVPIGGLLPTGAQPWEQAVREAEQEAGQAMQDAILATSAGNAHMLAYTRDVRGQPERPAFPFETNGGLSRDEVFYWVATIPDDVQPTPRDGEVKNFTRLSPSALLESLITQPEQWKINSGVMLLMDLLENGHIPQDHPEYEGLKVALKAMQIPALVD